MAFEANKEKLLIALNQDAERYREAFSKGRDTGYAKRDEEIVRCKDCKHAEILKWLDDAIICKKHSFTGVRPEEFFCADGRRREDDA